MAIKEQISLTTPHGNELRAEVDLTNYQVNVAKVVDRLTGVMRPLTEEALLDLGDAMRAKTLQEQALAEAGHIQQTLDRFGRLASALGNNNAGLEPYLAEAKQHQDVAEHMGIQAERLQDRVLRIADRINDGVGGNAGLPNFKASGTREV